MTAQADFLEADAANSLVPVARPSESLPAVAPQVSGNTANVLSLIQTGIDKGMTPEAMGQLVTLYERVMAKDAEAAFNEAKRAFQAECPVIGKNRDGASLKEKDDTGRPMPGRAKPAYRFADLEKIVTTIRPLLERHGFTYDFDQEYKGDIVTVRCYLRHKGGHVQVTPFAGPWATNAGMSAIQKSASATTFCQRYALRMALGLPVGEDDDAPPQHDNPDADPNAPHVAPRGERDNPVTGPEMKSLAKDWAEVFNGGDYYGDQFTAWVQKITGSNWDAATKKPLLRDDYESCRKELP